VSTRVRILEEYYNYRPPVRVYRSVEVLLRYVPEEHLNGLRTITITNSEYMGKALKGKFIQDKRRFRASDCRGMYWNNQIWLILDQICEVDTFMIIPAVRTILIGEVLYHEIGHHIHKIEQPGFRKDKEAFADEWRDKLMQTFVRQRYWYLLGVLKLFLPVFRRLHSKLSDCDQVAEPVER
jgi:hypothetical protein